MRRGMIDFNLEIIDTPGFGDAKSLEHDGKLKERIRQLFTNKGRKGISQLNAICFVVPAGNVRLTAVQKYIFASMMSIFGKDLEEKIYVFSTYADAKDPPGKGALTEYNVPHERMLKFNNSALFANTTHTNKDRNDAEFLKMFWDMGKRSFKIFFDDLKKEEPVSLQMSSDALRKQRGPRNIDPIFDR